MEMSDTLKKRIDDMPYEEMLKQVRFAPMGDPLFIGEVGDYFMAKKAEKSTFLEDGEAVAISKKIGWRK